MSGVSDDRWSCPDCGRVVPLQVVTTLRRARARLRRVQEDHAQAHARQARAAAARVLNGGPQ